MVSMRTPVLALLLIAACGPAQVYYSCPDPAPFSQVLRESDTIACDVFQYDALQALQMLDAAGVVPTGADHDFGRMTVYIDATWDDLPGKPNQNGEYQSLDGSAHVTVQVRALLHEMLHHWDYIHGVLTTNEHPQWCAKGYGPHGTCPGSLDDRYQSVAQPVDIHR